MPENIDRLLNQEIREKKQVAQSAKYRASRTGKTGSIKMPADFAGKDYSKNSPLVSYSLNEIIEKINKTPLLKELLKEKLEANHNQFMEAVDQAIEAIFEANRELVEQLLVEVGNLRQEMEKLQARLEKIDGTRIPSRQQRPEQLQRTKKELFEKLKECENKGVELKTAEILHRYPCFSYYLYQKKVWNGFREMLEEYRSFEI